VDVELLRQLSQCSIAFDGRNLLIVSPDSPSTACPLSGRNSTYRSVQILEAGASRSGRSPDSLKMKNPNAPPKREEDWGKEEMAISLILKRAPMGSNGRIGPTCSMATFVEIRLVRSCPSWLHASNNLTRAL
jgi:hypothetical protein